MFYVDGIVVSPGTTGAVTATTPFIEAIRASDLDDHCAILGFNIVVIAQRMPFQLKVCAT